MTELSIEDRRKRLRYRAWHRGTKEADLVLGRFADRFAGEFGPENCGWFEMLLEEQDQDILDWVFGRSEPPAHLSGAWMDRLLNPDDSSHQS